MVVCIVNMYDALFGNQLYISLLCTGDSLVISGLIIFSVAVVITGWRRRWWSRISSFGTLKSVSWTRSMFLWHFTCKTFPFTLTLSRIVTFWWTASLTFLLLPLLLFFLFLLMFFLNFFIGYQFFIAALLFCFHWNLHRLWSAAFQHQFFPVCVKFF